MSTENNSQVGVEKNLKQGSYGKVKIHKHSILKQLSFPLEVIAGLKLKFSGGIGVNQTLSDGVESLTKTETGNELTMEDIEMCHKTLKSVSRSFAGVISQLPNTPKEPLRLAIGVFYLALRALDTIEDDMDLTRFKPYVTTVDEEFAKTKNTLATLEAKQRMLRDFYLYLVKPKKGENGVNYTPISGIGEGDEALLLKKYDSIIRAQFALPLKAQKVIVDITKEMGEGMADYISRDLTNGTEDAPDFRQYCHIVAGTVGDGLTQLWAAFDLEKKELVKQQELWDEMGLFLQETNIIRDYLEDLVDGRAFWPKSVWSLYVPKQNGTLGSLVDAEQCSEEQRMGCLNHMITNALERAPSCIKYLDELSCAPILKFCALPQIMAIATLSECYNNPKVFTGVVKIRKGLAARLVLDSCGISETEGKLDKTIVALREGYLKWFKIGAETIMSKIPSNDPNAERTKKACKTIIALSNERTGNSSKKSNSPFSSAVAVGVGLGLIVYFFKV